jgi:short-subunit dehydrogenase
MNPKMSLMRPVCLITGASAGIGAALARVFAEHGHALVLTARRQAQLDRLADEIAAAGHARPHVIVADIGTSGGTDLLAEALRAAGLEPSIVVNNAGFGLLGEAADLDRERQLEMIDLNVRALTDLSLRWLEPVTRHGGGILNVASVAGFLPGPGMAVYNATKAFVVSFSEALHQEIALDGVRVCALCPGPVETEFFGRLFPAPIQPFGRTGGARGLCGLHGRTPPGGAGNAQPHHDPSAAAVSASPDRRRGGTLVESRPPVRLTAPPISVIPERLK